MNPAAWHSFAVTAAWLAVWFGLTLAAAVEADEQYIQVTDLGEEPINAEGWN